MWTYPSLYFFHQSNEIEGTALACVPKWSGTQATLRGNEEGEGGGLSSSAMSTPFPEALFTFRVFMT